MRMGYQRKRSRTEFEFEISIHPMNYVLWHEYIKFTRDEGNHIQIRKTFERAIKNLPREERKFWWPEYIYLWITYAYFEEFEAKDINRARDVYSRCIRLIPHKKFSFDNVWILAANLEIKQENYEEARKIFESAIEKSPEKKIFKTYIEMEHEIGELKRCQALYMRYVQWCEDDDYSCWIEYTIFERSISNPNRARFIYDIAISQPALCKCKKLWDSYIDFEISEGEFEKVRELFKKLLERSKSVDVWLSYARFEASLIKDIVVEDEEERKKKGKNTIFGEICVQRVRDVFEKAIDYFINSRKARELLFEEWEILEEGFGSLGDVKLILHKESRLNSKSKAIFLS